MAKKIAIVTGASSGIGKKLALGVAERYEIDELWAVARSRERLEALQADTEVTVRAIPVDLTTPEAISTLNAMLEEEQPHVSVLINASGYGMFERFENISAEDNLGMIDLNCRALTAVTQTALPYLGEGGIIVNIASMAAFQPVPYINVYAATKAYVLSFSRALNRELKSRKIKVLAVCPFWTKTAFFDRSNKNSVIQHFEVMYDPAFIAEKTLKAMKKKKDYVVPGAYAKFTHALTKILPHSFVMKEFLRRQRLK